jgi:hypothetical protein
MPSFARQLMPAPLFNAMIRNSGIRISWMKGHVCPCTMSSDSPGSPNPTCNTCHGRGRWWENPLPPFIGLLTCMHTSEAADEPGATMDPRIGQQLHAEPTITIPSDALPMWSEATEFDAFLEVDSLTRYETALLVGGNTVLPYQQNLQVLSVTAYSVSGQVITPVSPSDYTVNNGQVTLSGYPEGTAYTVMYKASPVYIAWRRAGSMPHQRPFGAGTDALPTRFRGMMLDLWLRARNPFGSSASPGAI